MIFPYEDSYAKAHPFDRIVEGVLRPEMVEEKAQLMWTGWEQGIRVNLFINNRAGGNTPMIAQQIARRFLEMQPGES